MIRKRYLLTPVVISTPLLISHGTKAMTVQSSLSQEIPNCISEGKFGSRQVAKNKSNKKDGFCSLLLIYGKVHRACIHTAIFKARFLIFKDAAAATATKTKDSGVCCPPASAGGDQQAHLLVEFLPKNTFEQK